MIRVPILQRVSELDLSIIRAEPSASHVWDKSGIEVRLSGEVLFAIGKSPPALERAAVLLLGMSRETLREHVELRIAASLSVVLNTLEVVQVIDNTKAFEEVALESLSLELDDYGLSVQSFALRSLEAPREHTDALIEVHGADFALKVEALREGRAQSGAVDAPRALPLAFLPPPELGARLKTTVRDPSGDQGKLVLDADSLELTSNGVSVAAIHLEAPFTLMLSHSIEGSDTLLHIDIRQTRMGASTRLGLSSTTASFSSPVDGLTTQPNRFPRLDEAEMLQLLAGLRGIMQAQGEERWGHLG